MKNGGLQKGHHFLSLINALSVLPEEVIRVIGGVLYVVVMSWISAEGRRKILVLLA